MASKDSSPNSAASKSSSASKDSSPNDAASKDNSPNSAASKDSRRNNDSGDTDSGASEEAEVSHRSEARGNSRPQSPEASQALTKEAIEGSEGSPATLRQDSSSPSRKSETGPRRANSRASSEASDHSSKRLDSAPKRANRGNRSPAPEAEDGSPTKGDD